jgi:hypothetical protein
MWLTLSKCYWVNNIMIGVVFWWYEFKFRNPNLMGSINLEVFKCLKHRLLICGLIIVIVIINLKLAMSFVKISI